MREINKTIYKTLKMEEPTEGVNVSQLITDDLIQKSVSGEVKAKDGASDMLDKKSDIIHGKNTNLKKNLKASGTRVSLKVPTEIADSTTQTSKKVVKKVIKRSSGTGSIKIKKKIVKKAATGANKKVLKKKPTASNAKKETNPLMIIVILVVLAAAGGYAYIELM